MYFRNVKKANKNKLSYVGVPLLFLNNAELANIA